MTSQRFGGDSFHWLLLAVMALLPTIATATDDEEHNREPMAKTKQQRLYPKSSTNRDSI
jgi:hypothetical protein